MIRVVRAIGFGGLVALCVAIGAAAANTLLPESATGLGLSDSALNAQGGVLGGRIMKTSGTDSSGSWDAVEPGNEPATVRGSAADPDGGLRWTVRVYQSLTGATCAEAGRRVGAQFGRADEHAQLEPLPLEPAGACANLAVAPLSVALNIYATRPGQPARSAVFGVAGNDVAEMTLTASDGDSVDVPLDDRVFIVVRRGRELVGSRLDITLRDASVITRELG